MVTRTYIMRKKDMLFQNINALKTVEHVIAEIDQGLGNKSRTINTSSMPEVLATALGIGSGSALSFAALYLSGSVIGVSAAGVASALSTAGALVGGGATTGIFVLAAPIAILGFLGIKVAQKRRAQRLMNAKIFCYKRSLAHLASLKNAIQIESKTSDPERIEYLRALSITLQAAIKDLKHDLGIVQAKKFNLVNTLIPNTKRLIGTMAISLLLFLLSSPLTCLRLASITPPY